jgi:hypothetical protein
MTAAVAGSAIGTSRIESRHAGSPRQSHDNIFDGVMPGGECPHL